MLRDLHEDDRAFLTFIAGCGDPRHLVRMIGPLTPAWKVEALRRRLDAIVRPPDWADGFRYVEHVLTHPESSALAYRCQWELDHAGDRLESGECCNGRSRVVRFGNSLASRGPSRSMPGWASSLRAQLDHVHEDIATCDSLTINEYAPGASIWPHTDSFGYGTPIVSVSVGSPARFVLSRGADRIGRIAEVGSVIVLERDAARMCRHAIEAWTEQPGARWSIVFRVRALAP